MTQSIFIPKIMIIAERGYCSSGAIWKEKIAEIVDILPMFPNVGIQLRAKEYPLDLEELLMEWPIPKLSEAQIWLNGLHHPHALKRHLPEQDIETGHPLATSASIHSLSALQRSQHLHFLQYGAIFPTLKPVEPLGIENLRRICQQSAIPILAVGGIQSIAQIAECLQAGAYGISMGSAILHASNIPQTLQRYCDFILNHQGSKL